MNEITRRSADSAGGGPALRRDRACLIALSGRSSGQPIILDEQSILIGRGPAADVHVVDDGVSRRHALITRKSEEFVIRDIGSVNGTFVNGRRIEQIVLRDGDKIRLGPSAVLKFELQDELDEAFHRAVYDALAADTLTQVHNRRYLLKRMDSELALARRRRLPLSLLVFDVDHLRRINDAHGRQAGDLVLRQVATVVGEIIRAEDVLARYDGDQFAVLCLFLDEAGVVEMGERIRRRVAGEPFNLGGSEAWITVSIGALTIPGGACDPAGAIHLADRALCRAKHEGRNRIATASAPLAP